jgi:hypothetical protein
MIRQKTTALFLFVFAASWLQAIPPEDRISRLDRKQKIRLLELYLKDHPFISHSPDWKHAPETTNHFFTTPIYKKLKGNFLKGWEYDEGFVMESKSIQLLPVQGVGESRRYIDEITVQIKRGFAKRGIKIQDNANTRLSLCLVGVEPVISPQSLPGIIIEMYVKNKRSRKAYLFRFATGKKTGLPDALKDAADIIILKCLFFTEDNIQKIKEHIRKNVR